jgi:6-phosphofructokinase 1
MFPETFGTMYGGWHGIEGILKEDLLDLSVQSNDEVALLRYTPAAGVIGSCRYKLKQGQDDDFQRVVDVMKSHDVGYFFYIGGNDSMDTAHKVSRIANDQGLDLVAVGIPKTIDNDIGDPGFKLIDHSPGYGSTARYWMGIVQTALEENAGMCQSEPVLVLQAMGRKTGFIPAAARLADPKREMPLHIYMPESGVTAEEMADTVSDQLRRDGRCLVVVSEGFDVGELGERTDGFGHIEYGASRLTVAQKVVNMLNARGLPVPGQATGQVPGTDQRSTSLHASTVDLDEAYRVAQKAVLIAREGESGWMATILRDPGPIYCVRYDKVPLDKMANSERHFPKEWLAPNRTDVTDDFVRYAKPLVGEDWISVPAVDGRHRFARFKRVFAEKKLPEYMLQTLR